MTVANVAVPDSLELALSPLWLTEALGQRFRDITVRAVTPGPVIDRISTNARFVIDFVGDAPDGLSAALCVKGYFNDIGRAARQIGAPEAYFYRHLAVHTRCARCAASTPTSTPPPTTVSSSPKTLWRREPHS